VGTPSPHTAARFVYYLAYCNTPGNNEILSRPTPGTEQVNNIELLLLRAAGEALRANIGSKSAISLQPFFFFEN